MPGTDGLTAVKQLRRLFPDTRVILLTNYDDPFLVRYALGAGASGFVLKAYAATELVEAIHTVAGGGTYVSSAIAV
jgi:DNA-binding NarL/FixJ family response regulator